MKRLAGKTAIITGGARGMGEATARLFVEHGAQVVIGDVLEAEGNALADELGQHATFVRLDVSSEADWANAVAAAEKLGTLNVLVNNAAIMRMSAITDTTVDDFMQIVQVNQLGTFLGIRSVIAPMKAAGGGSI
ncbi:MAG TPA: 3-alpha-hydroxysteroid dehydrogenase, partial [Haliea salexigens]|nr:3-alpha-hydroxysteroid dehydrogenase [Haliea salexigens]